MRGNRFSIWMFGFILLTTLFLGSLFLCPIKATAAEADILPALSELTGDSSSNVWVVGNSELQGSFETITEAVNAAADGDVILIYPGEYDESLDIRDKDLIMLGLDKDTCIIKYETTHYTAPVLNGAAGTFCNLTFYGYKGEKSEVKTPDDSLIGPDDIVDCFSGYVLHIDDDYEYGRSITFNNCNIISENNNCIGMGMRNHFTATFNNCYIRSTGVAGILYVHDPDNILFAGDDMHLNFIGNIWVNFGYPYLMSTKSIYYGNHIDVTFQNVNTYCYATDIEDFYFAGNATTSTDIRYIVAGLMPSASPVFVLEQGRFADCIKLLRSADSCGIPGIYFIPDSSVTNENQVSTIASVFYVVNPFDLPGEGFAGSSTFHLTNDSFGNTLEEMNFVR